MLNYFYLILSLFLICSCEHDTLDEGTQMLYPEAYEQFSGGEGTVFIEGFNAFELKVPDMSYENQNLFAIGNSLFEQNWVTAPASTTGRDGLGPLFNARACATCHFKDGRGRPPSSFGDINHGLLVQLSINGTDIHGDPLPHPVYGGQLQDQSIMGISPEGHIVINTELITGQYADGTSYTLSKPVYTFAGLNYGPLENVMFSPRVAPQMIGLGLLDAIADLDILANVDEADSNKDGISGRAVYVWNKETNTYTLGKYGWKSSVPTIKDQVATAFSFDMGLTSSLFTATECPPGIDCSSIPNGGIPEVIDEALEQVTVYSKTLAVPSRRNHDNQNVLKGKQIFNQLDCTKCHIPKHHTQTNYHIPQLANQIIWPYTDMLLHDMGEELSDHRPVKGVHGNEWRTPPLWGLGYTQEVSGHTQLLHDGRANNIEEAILWHGGEAAKSKQKFINLSLEDRNYLLDFLNSL
ncbi:thiol oxidoreductase [Flavobacteriaceae bacterium Ap0902]|nr:thiol oxidoreductase [Flavobacteriaceae bacterium Ap0902]